MAGCGWVLQVVNKYGSVWVGVVGRERIWLGVAGFEQIWQMWVGVVGGEKILLVVAGCKKILNSVGWCDRV